VLLSQNEISITIDVFGINVRIETMRDGQSVQSLHES